MQNGIFSIEDLTMRTREILVKAREERFFLEDGKLVPFSEDFPIGKKRYTYRIMDVMGRAAIIANGVMRSEELSLYLQEREVPIQHTWQEFSYTFMDKLFAEAGEFDLGDTMAELAAEATYNTLEEIGWIGVDGTKSLGLVNNPNVNTVLLAADGTAGSTRIADKTATQMLRDLNIIANTSQRVSKRTFISDILLVTQDIWDAITQTYLTSSGNNTTTVYAAFLEAQRLQNGIKEIICIPQLATMGVGGTSLAVAYKNSPRALHLVRPRTTIQRPWQEDVRGYHSAFLAASGGVVVKQGVSMTYAPGA